MCNDTIFQQAEREARDRITEADWLQADLEHNRQKTCPVARQVVIDNLTWHEAQMRLLTKEAL